jgi:hypothetical protein
MYQRINYISLILSLCLVILNTSCAEHKGSKEDVFFVLNKISGNTITGGTKAILVLSDQNCLSCNRKFSKLIESYIDSDKCKIVIAANENAVDISPFLGKKNVYVDSSNILTIHDIISTSSVFFIKNGMVDTIVKITAANIDNEFDLILKRLETEL